MATVAASTGNYDDWTREQLIERLTRLDRPITSPVLPKRSPNKPFDFSSYHTRKIALKFCYSGQEYGGLAYQKVSGPLPTVEGVLFDALAKARLVEAEAGYDGCKWERCGRTDRGVSAGGQVVSLWVRTGKQKLEHDYVPILNNLLPHTIRILAWSPVSESFSARFSCKQRHYKYFFSPKGLDIPRMQEAAARLIGEHDFRNLCKVDAQKQIKVFKRKILNAYVEPLGEDVDSIYVFNLVGTAFLYHQVRHIMSILFLVGAGLEHPSLVTRLMNVDEGLETPVEHEESYEVVDRKPIYQMADGMPLMLWDCTYSDEDVSWRTSTKPENPGSSHSFKNIYEQLETIHTRSLVHASLTKYFFLAASQHHSPPPNILPIPKEDFPRINDILTGKRIHIPLGGGTFKRVWNYTPVLKRERLETVDVINEKWRLKRGKRLEEIQNMSGDDGDGDE
ncbi:pseudouridine synthase [Cyathus striatus]|nr:pseudouridine synthase [Cyathus striatus]